MPERTEHGGVLRASCVATVLRVHGYQPTEVDVNQDTSPAGHGAGEGSHDRGRG